ncbi:FKBP-type peptidyl-prolyl cis-trans isomerase [Solirhodobacter olei]|uniref:FKBP-type peptidyl-prolyl cis-trans isomerase n=1 Tax=Solirhodobacter olei TaxID=2493082 RepID=UPI000FD96450|nr:peptidylprolyl isomerase [Solirhodobacter olei]
MTQVKSGDTVRIHYTGTLTDGSVFDSSEGRDPLEFTAGSGQIIPGLDAAILGMAPGEERTVTVPAADAYGPHDPSGRQEVPRAQVPDGIPLDPGTRLQLSRADGGAIPVTVAEVTEEVVVLDTNHPLAGQDLTFKVAVVEIA